MNLCLPNQYDFEKDILWNIIHIRGENSKMSELKRTLKTCYKGHTTYKYNSSGYANKKRVREEDLVEEGIKRWDDANEWICDGIKKTNNNHHTKDPQPRKGMWPKVYPITQITSNLEQLAGIAQGVRLVTFWIHAPFSVLPMNCNTNADDELRLSKY